MKKYIYLLLASLIWVTTACKEEESLLYDENDARLYFNYGIYTIDSIDYSFFTKKADVLVDTVFVKINTMGGLKNVDRPIKIVQLNENDLDAAQSGVHYVAFDDTELAKLNVIKADSVSLLFAILVIKDPSLDLKIVRLKLGIEENEHFKNGIDKYQTYVVKITSKATKPSNWDTNWAVFFGKSWGTVKMRFAIDITGITDWVTPLPLTNGFFFRDKCKAALIKYNNDNPGNPLREPDTGELVSFDWY